MFKQLTKRVYYLEHNEDTDRPVLGYIKGDKFSLMIDGGNSAKHVGIYMEELDKRQLSHPKFVAITHWHWDHTFGLSAANAIIIANSLTNKQLCKMRGWKWDEESMDKRVTAGEEIEFCNSMIKKEYPQKDNIKVINADIVFNDYLMLDLGGITCQMIKIGGCHSDDSTIFYLQEEKILFIGDAACEDLYHGEGYDKDKLKKVIRILSEIEFDIVIEGHNEHTDKAELLEYLQGKLAEI
ncbi:MULTISPECIES: MBL fold metallo-hydrolase [Clostridium]|uniref:MBL fold metallo-hydrolase n=1 Tax=Clostridium TaxID=1485 RepID=UPI00024BA32A|nr:MULTISPECIES: MBL fold metallo-hydrolase [Clostridium]EHN16456.1 metallo-beta-lactamase family protein [Clostridium sporogenes PA 3679]MCW6106783.1 MBL fold metallo-hydrolase [Clostridium sporogenes]MDU4598564.1 MBL fold metallo-hydrolase [Clostridium sporogenes]MDU7253211.1 MBL fold metallo-hydrolase [Clostridium sp.]NFQ35498.1 MBL fold metallo-hydrolase [Clostridium sporogenes]